MPRPENIPLILIGAVIAAYWYRVLRMARKQRKRSGRAANLIPAERIGRLLRLLWAPAVVVWIGHPIAAAFWSDAPKLMPPLIDVGWWRWPCAVAVFAGFLVTRE